MEAWWVAMTLYEKISVCIAIPSTLVLVLQLILTLIGIGGGESDFDGGEVDLDGDGIPDGIDLDGDGLPDTDAGGGDGFGISGFRLFTVRGLVAFLAVMGWVGYSLSKSDLPVWLCSLIALASGFCMMALIALIFHYFSKIQTNGVVDIRKAIGQSGTVYLNVPPKRSGAGKVNVVVQGKYGEYEAVTDEENTLGFGCEVTIIGLSGQNTLVVRKK